VAKALTEKETIEREEFEKLIRPNRSKRVEKLKIKSKKIY
jgi:hypothetical protein